jgi:hypothetical protein
LATPNVAEEVRVRGHLDVGELALLVLVEAGDVIGAGERARQPALRRVEAAVAEHVLDPPIDLVGVLQAAGVGIGGHGGSSFGALGAMFDSCPPWRRLGERSAKESLPAAFW